ECDRGRHVARRSGCPENTALISSSHSRSFTVDMLSRSFSLDLASPALLPWTWVPPLPYAMPYPGDATLEPH
ncbi:MAG TPA: hypothetical protein QGF05_02900, partial [Dehalococcoidia bacterium]|nr:hypothetical protein [Dehalococcoidia bacterium]